MTQCPQAEPATTAQRPRLGAHTIAAPATSLSGFAAATALTAGHGPPWLAWFATAISQVLAIALAVEAMIGRLRYQRLHADVVQRGLQLCHTAEETRDLLSDLASTHPDHLGTRLSYRDTRSARRARETSHGPACRRTSAV